MCIIDKNFEMGGIIVAPTKVKYKKSKDTISSIVSATKRLLESRSYANLTIRDITCNPPPTLDLTLTAANFGNLAEDASNADLAAGVVNMVLEAIGTMTVLACQCCDSKTVVLTGSMTTLTQAESNFKNFERLYGIHYIIPENATFATAIGAALCSLREV